MLCSFTAMATASCQVKEVKEDFSRCQGWFKAPPIIVPAVRESLDGWVKDGPMMHCRCNLSTITLFKYPTSPVERLQGWESSCHTH